MTATSIRRPKSAETPTRAEASLASIESAVRQYGEILESSDPKAVAIYMSLWKASQFQMLENTRAIDALNMPVSVSRSRLTVLRTLFFAENQQMALNEISKSTGITPAMVTHLIEGLATAGLVRRSGSSEDRRVRIAQLTPAGEAAFHQVLPVISKRMTEACAHLSDTEKDTLIRLLKSLC